MSNHEVNEKFREAIVAGIFYADEPEVLTELVDSALAEANPAGTNARAILTPHAGFAYTGFLQALAWKSAGSRPIKRVVLIAPHHRSRGSRMYLPESRYFRTPLGDIPIDVAACDEIESCGTFFEINDMPHLEEHAIEVQLPFMKRLFPDAALIPLIADGHELAAIMTVARALDLVLGSERDTTLIAVSSNLSSSVVEADAARQADELLERIFQGDWHWIINSREREQNTACGGNAIAEIMATSMLAGSRFSVLGRSDSRALDGDKADRIIQYAAAAWYPGG
jgi:AmmeMemoRadiSam system protein B